MNGSNEQTNSENHVSRKSGRFRPGSSGNQHGRPKGSRTRATNLTQQLLEEEAESITRALIKSAKNGDATALKIYFDRVCPAIRSQPIIIDLSVPQDARAASNHRSHGARCNCI